MIGAGRQSVKIDKVTAHLPIAATVGHYDLVRDRASEA